MSECVQKSDEDKVTFEAKEMGMERKKERGAGEMPTSNAGNDIVTVFITTLRRMTSV